MGLLSGLGKSLSKGFKSFKRALGKTGNVFSGIGSFFDSTQADVEDAWDDYTGKNIAEKNLEFQKKQFEEQQWLNREQMKREDNAMVRKVTDLKNAGLNPILAANGTGAPSAPLHVASAPQMPDYSGGVREGAGQLSQLFLNLTKMKKDFAVQDAEIRKMNAEKGYFDVLKGKVSAETTGLNIDNETKGKLNELKVQSLDLDNQLKSGTLQNNILMSYKKLQQVDVDIQNSRLDGMLKELHITHEDVMIEQDRLRNKLYVQDYEKGELELTAKTISIYKAVAEYNSYMFDIDFYNRLHNLPVGYNIPMLGRNTDYVKGLLSSAWKEVKDFASGHFDFKRFSDFTHDLVFGTSKALSEVSKAFGISKNNLIYSFRRGDDGVRRNHGMFYVGGRH